MRTSPRCRYLCGEFQRGAHHVLGVQITPRQSFSAVRSQSGTSNRVGTMYHSTTIPRRVTFEQERLVVGGEGGLETRSPYFFLQTFGRTYREQLLGLGQRIVYSSVLLAFDSGQQPTSSNNAPLLRDYSYPCLQSISLAISKT